MGAGRVVWQDIAKIDHEIQTGDFFTNLVLTKAFRELGPRNRIHLLGLVSDGGVHSSDRHYKALIQLARRSGLKPDQLCFHAITDGRDTLPRSAERFIADLEATLASEGVGFIATVSGRYYTMDRDTNWDRTQLAWDCLTLGNGDIAPNALDAVRMSYAAGASDEFIKPQLIAAHGKPIGRIQDGDTVLFFNFRADRARQLSRALTEGDEFDAKCFRRNARPKVRLVTMTPYQQGLRAEVAYANDRPANTLGQVVADAGIAQFRCAETEKYAHVTYFFSGGREEPFADETRALIPSPKVATYDLQPEMSLPAVADAVCAAVHEGKHGLIVTNFANGDMIGHTGVFAAAVDAVRAIDQALRRVVHAAQGRGYSIVITADHGNCEEMADAGGNLLTNHSYNRVPLLFIPSSSLPKSLQRAGLKPDGALCDVAPTLLELMGEEQPPEMTGQSFLIPDNI